MVCLWVVVSCDSSLCVGVLVWGVWVVCGCVCVGCVCGCVLYECLHCNWCGR